MQIQTELDGIGWNWTKLDGMDGIRWNCAELCRIGIGQNCMELFAINLNWMYTNILLNCKK